MILLIKFDKPCDECGKKYALGRNSLFGRAYESGHTKDCSWYDDGKNEKNYSHEIYKHDRKYKKLTSNIQSVTIALAVIAIAISFAAVIIVIDSNNVDPLVQTNNQDIEKIYKLIGTNVENRVQEDVDIMKRVVSTQETILSWKKVILSQDDMIIDLKARILQLEDANRTENANQLDVPEQATPKRTFNLLTLDSGGVQKDTYRINDIVYLAGDTNANAKPTLTLKIRDESGTIVNGPEGQEFGVSNDSRFTAVYSIPAGLSSGVYTATFSDGNIVDSIRFNVE